MNCQSALYIWLLNVRGPLHLYFNNSLVDILILCNYIFVCMKDINFILIAMVPIIQVLVKYVYVCYLWFYTVICFCLLYIVSNFLEIPRTLIFQLSKLNLINFFKRKSSILQLVCSAYTRTEFVTSCPNFS